MVSRITDRCQRSHLLKDRLQLCLRPHIGNRIGLFRILRLFAEQIADTNPEEFVKIALENGGKAKPFKQRIALCTRLFQYTRIKAQPGKLAVFKALIFHCVTPFHVFVSFLL